MNRLMTGFAVATMLHLAPNAAAQTPEEFDATSQPTSAPSGNSSQPTKAAPERAFAVITADKVNLRGGAGDFHPEVMKLDRGDVVEFVAKNGKWTEVHVPGGFVCWCKRGLGKRNYLDVKPTGEAVVLVDDLQLRPQASVEFPALGKLGAGDKVTVLAEAGEWMKLLAPDKETLFVYSDFVKVEGDQELLGADFAVRAAEVRAGLLREGEVAREAVLRAQQVRDWNDRVKALDEKLAAVSKSKDDRPQQFDLLAAEYEKAATEAPKDTAAGELKERAESLRAEARRERDLAAAETKAKEIESKMQAIDDQYRDAAEAKRKEIEARDRTVQKGKFLLNGLGELRVDVASEIGGDRPIYTLVKAGKRHYFVVSDRYDLSEYRDKTVGITEWTVEESPAKLELKTVRVTRMEVLN